MDKNMNNSTNRVANNFEMTTKLEIYCKLFLQNLRFLLSIIVENIMTNLKHFVKNF